MEKPISLSCCRKQAKRYLSNVMVRRPESCQGVANPDCVNMLFKQEQHARARCIIHERCEWGLRHLVVESGDALRTFFQVANLCSMVGMHPNQNPFHAASLNIASYTILWSPPTRLYLCPSITSVIDLSEITPDSTHTSRWGQHPETSSRWLIYEVSNGMVWNATILNIMFFNLSSFQVISGVLT